MTDYTRAEAELDAKRDAKREEGEKRVARLKDEVIADPEMLFEVCNCRKLDELQTKFYYLIGLLCAQGSSIHQYPVEPLLQEQINDTVKEFAEHVETRVEMYLEENSDEA